QEPGSAHVEDCTRPRDGDEWWEGFDRIRSFSSHDETHSGRHVITKASIQRFAQPKGNANRRRVSIMRQKSQLEAAASVTPLSLALSTLGPTDGLEGYPLRRPRGVGYSPY